MRNCERCGGEVSWTDDTVRLAGTVTATLCNPCLRQYNDYFYESAEFAESILVAAQSAHYDSLATAGQPVSQEAWLDQARWQAANQKAMAAMSNRFLATVPARVER
jgi:hypothetical protein